MKNIFAYTIIWFIAGLFLYYYFWHNINEICVFICGILLVSVPFFASIFMLIKVKTLKNEERKKEYIIAAHILNVIYIAYFYGIIRLFMFFKSL